MTATPIPEWLNQEVNDYFSAPLNVKPALVLDIGANVGAFARRAHQEWPAARVICYEPMPFNISQLRQNVAADWCEVVPCAVREQAGEADIYVGDMFVTSGFVKGPRQTSRTLRVSCLAARELPAADLVKVDTEGSEVEILAALDLSRMRVIMLEHHSSNDAAIIKQRLHARQFKILRDESYREVGTMIFARDW